MKRACRRRGVTLVEVIVSIVILAVAIIPVYSMMSRGISTVGRTEDHLIAYNLAEKIVENLKSHLTNPAKLIEAVKLETPGAAAPPILEYFKEEEDMNADGKLEALESVLAAIPGDQGKQGLRVFEKFHYTIKNKEIFPPLNMINAKAGQDKYELVSGVTKVVTVAWKDAGGHMRKVSLEHFQSLYGNYQFVIRGNYDDAPIFYGPGSEALNRAYKANLKLARSMTEDANLAKMWIPPDHLVFKSNMYWPGDPMATPLLKGKTRINVKVHLLSKVSGLTFEEVIDGDPKKGQTRTQIEKATLREGLSAEEKGKGFISSRFIQSIDEMNLKCVSCHSQWFFRTDPQLKSKAEMYLGKDFLTEYQGKLKGVASGTNPDGTPKFNKTTNGDEGKSLETEYKFTDTGLKSLTGGTEDFSGNITFQQARASAEVFKGREDYVEMK